MEQLVLVLVIIVLGVLVIFLMWQNRKKNSQEGDTGLVMLQNQLTEIRNTLDSKLGDSTKMFQQQHGQSAKLIENITEKLTRLDETNKQVVGFTDQLQRLQDILKNPKQRGVLGEYYLEALLKNAFQPGQYKMQYRFKNGEIVDAVLFVGKQIIPIDSKFSLENYNRIVEERDTTKRETLEKIFAQDLKNRVDETAKYIRPQEGTTEYAFMFIPAEAIFSDLLDNRIGAIKANTRSLIEYAVYEKKVHIVSPTTFYVTLQSMWQGMRAYQIQEETERILKEVGMLQRHLKAYEEYMQKLGNHLGTSIGAYNSAYKEFGKIDKDMLKLTGSSNNVDVLGLERPDQET